MSENKVVDVILHCQKQIKKDVLPEEKLLHYLGRLSRLRITVHDLAETGIGRTVNQLSRNEGAVGQAADTLVRSWKLMVSEQQNQPEPDPESEESDSNTESSEDDDEEEEEVNNPDEPEPYEIENQIIEPAPTFPSGHASRDDRHLRIEPLANQSRNSEDDNDEPEMDDIDDIHDPYMENGFISVANVHTDDENDEEDDEDDDDHESDTSVHLQIAHEEQPHETQRTDVKLNPYTKQDKHHVSQIHAFEENVNSRNSYSKGSQHRTEENGDKRYSSSKSSHHYNDKSDKSQSSNSSSKDIKELKEHRHQSSKSHHYGESKERSLRHSEQSSEHKSHHSSRSEKSRESNNYKSDSSSSNAEKHYKDRDKQRHADKYSKESSSQYREREKEAKPEKERPRDYKTVSDHHRSSHSHHSKDKNRETSSSSNSLKKSSLEINRKPESHSHEERKRRENSDVTESSSSKKQKLVLKEEIDSTSGVNFADVLGSLDTSSSKNKKVRKEEPEKPPRKHEPHSSSSPFLKPESLKKHGSSSPSKHSRESGSSTSKKSEKYESVKLTKKPTQSKIESVIKTAVNISPNYKPTSSSVPKPSSSNGSAVTLSQADFSDIGSVDYWDNNGKGPSSSTSQEDTISTMLSNRNRNARSKVYSGVKSARRGEVPTLYDLCMQVIKDNIGDLGYTGGIPYEILKPALERANPIQLINIEEQNDYLIGETDELWQFHCKRDCRARMPDETESWRELYERCKLEQKTRFERIKKQMKRSIESAEPVRKAKLAYVDTTTGPRFNRQKAQTIKNGMKSLKIKEEKGPKRGVSSSASAGFNNPRGSGEGIVEEAAVIIAPGSRAGHAPAPSVSRDTRESTAKLKPKKAPLMQKTMKLIRSLNRR